MTATFDIEAAKRPVNLSLNEDLVAKARLLTSNLSAEVECLLAEFVAQQVKQREQEAESLRRCARAADAFIARNGSLSDEFTAF